jgi:hypothetical protein
MNLLLLTKEWDQDDKKVRMRDANSLQIHVPVTVTLVFSCFRDGNSWSFTFV